MTPIFFLFSFLIAISSFCTRHAFANPPQPTLDPDFDSTLYTLTDVVCVGTGNVGREYMAIKGDINPENNAIRTGEDGTFAISGFRLNMDQLTEVGDSDAETQLILHKKATIKSEIPVRLENCEPGKSMLRTVGDSTHYSLAKYLEILPFQARCIQKSFNDCVDQRQLMGRALEDAEIQGKQLLIVLGRSDCVWSNALLDYLNQSRSTNTNFVIRSIAVNRENHTGHTVGKSLTTVTDPSLATAGVPLLFLINPKTNKVAAIHPVDMEKEYSYYFDRVDAAIRSKQEVIK